MALLHHNGCKNAFKESLAGSPGNLMFWLKPEKAARTLLKNSKKDPDVITMTKK